MHLNELLHIYLQFVKMNHILAYLDMSSDTKIFPLLSEYILYLYLS